MREKSPTFDDLCIRSALRSKLLRDHSIEEDTVLVEELGLCRGRVRIDMAVVDSQLHGYEIKSDCDNLARLKAQAEVYDKILDRVTLVVGDRYLELGSAIVPAWWGVLHVQPFAGEMCFKIVRPAKKNPERDPCSLVELLWLDNAIKLLETREAVRGVRGKPRRMVWDRVCNHFSIDEIADAVRAQLKARLENQVPA